MKIYKQMHLEHSLLILILGGFWLNLGFCQEQVDTRPQITIDRNDKIIRVIQNGTRAEGARTILLNPKCEEEIRLSTFFAPTPAFVETLVNETRIVSSIAFIKKPNKKEESKEPEVERESEPSPDSETSAEANVEANEDIQNQGLETNVDAVVESSPETDLESEINIKPEADTELNQAVESNETESNPVPEEDLDVNSELESENVEPETDTELNQAVESNEVESNPVPEEGLEVNPKLESEEETLEMVGGTLEFTDRTRCPENIQATTTADVTVEEGRSVITGSKFIYDNATGIGNMAGPVNLERKAEGDSPALSGTSDTMDFNVDEDLTILKGNVTIESDGRVSEAETVEFDEQASLAILLGGPAESRKGDDLVKGEVITYYLDSNDVVADKNIQASFELDP